MLGWQSAIRNTSKDVGIADTNIEHFLHSIFLVLGMHCSKIRRTVSSLLR